MIATLRSAGHSINMPTVRPGLRLACLALLLVAAGATDSAAADDAAHDSIQLTGQQDFPSATLRGYGALSGTLKSSASPAASVLAITCENEDKAKLVLAKYLSDLHQIAPIPSVTVAGPSGPLPAYTAADQGALLAVRDGATVDLLAAESPEILARLARQVLPANHTLASTAEVTVPMALDRFDKYGLQCYYHPYSAPQDRTPSSTVVPDQLKDFAFAQEENHLGLVLAQGPTPQETADNISTRNELDWVQREAEKTQLPLGINLDVYRVFALMNRYPEQEIQYQPQFMGGWYGSLNFSEEIPSWNGFDLKDHALGEVQDSIRDMAKGPDITDWLEPHSEMGHGVADYLLEYGPVADQGYRTYLQSHYDSLATVSQRWLGDPAALKSWDDVHVPELYSFLGWGPDAVDLTGQWRISKDAPYDASSAAPGLNDSLWPEVAAPGNAIVRFLPRHPAIFRRHITIDPAWRKAHARVWLYTFDLNDNRGGANPGWNVPANTYVQVYVNGTLIPENPPRISESHWAALEVTNQLVAGDNQITIELPSGLFNGRVYLSPHEPLLYPNLGPRMNAQWADFADWNRWSREQAVTRGVQMIRQVDPISGVKLAAAAEYADGIKEAAIHYGGDLHDTGGAAGFWHEWQPALMRGANLPNSAEPGGPAANARELEGFFGRWITEGVNQVDYFMELGDLEWYPDIRKCLDENRAIFTSFGKYHPPVAQVAALYSNRNTYIVDFPWSDNYHPGANPDHLGSGYWHWNVRSVLRNFYESDGLSESSFTDGDAARYPVVIDTNTTIMEPKLVDEIEKYVRNGGTFVTFVQTGRHTSADKDAWPIEKLTGYHVTSLLQKNPWQTDALAWAPGQKIFSGSWMDQARADGLSLQKVAPDAQDLAYWKDGSVAIGLRPLGKGAIIQVGCRFTKGGLPQRIDYDVWNYYKSQSSLDQWGLPPNTDHGLLSPELRATRQLFSQILQWRHIAGMPMRLEPDNEHIMLRHDISNNGLFDVWSLWNDSTTDTFNGHLVLDTPSHPSWRIDLRSGQREPVSGNKLEVTLAPFQTDIYLTPRGAITAAPSEWFTLQRNWWQGTADPGKPFPVPSSKLTVNLTPDWAFQPLDPSADATPLADPTLDDSSWKKMELGIFNIADFPGARHGIFRKRFTVSPDWNKGQVDLSLRYWAGTAIFDTGRIFLDGKLISTSADGFMDNDCGGALKPGTTHLLAIEVVGGKSQVVGVRGPAWLSYHPDPAQRLDLSGKWDLSADDLHYAPTALPGPFPGMAARRTVRVDTSEAARTVVVHVLGTGIRGLIINGRYVASQHDQPSNEENLNITPWVKFGQDNELVVTGAGNGTIKEVSLEFHDKGTYP
jgi:hypothetical protein